MVVSVHGERFPAEGAPLVGQRFEFVGLGRAGTLLPALDSATRKTGLLKHTSLADGEAMLIAPSNAVHTWFMKFDLDLIFVRRDGRVVKTRAGVKPWRMSAALRAFAVIEMRAGTLAERDTQPGDILELCRL